MDQVNTVSGSGGSATITNDSTPTISKLQANFTSPGQSVVYEFYTVNQTPYDAHLTTINYLNITGKTATKECTGSNGATASLVTKACEGISVKVEVGTTTANKTTSVTNHTLGKNSSEKVKVTIEYTGQAIDGSMTVTFGDISLIYSTAQGSGGTTGTSKVCTLDDADSDGTADVGEMVTCGTGDTAQRFYVMPDHENAGANTISMLAEYNITTTANPVQDTTGAENAVVFSSTNYWGEVGENTFVYDDRASISTYVNAYKSTLTGMGVSEDIVVTLPSHLQLTDSSIGCWYDAEWGEGQCEGPDWIYLTYYWTGTSGVGMYRDTDDGGYEYYMDSYNLYSVDSNGIYGNYDFTHRGGVRPIVIISESDIGVS